MAGLLAALVASACQTGESGAQQTCPSQIDRAQLELAYDTFDSSQWRDLLNRGCVDAAVAQLQAYREANASRLTPEQTRELHFHVGQAYAMSGRDNESIPHFEQAQGTDASQEWSAYVAATVAFLRHNAPALTAARASYASAPHFSEMRLSIIDGFIACPDRPYMEAAHCRMQMDH